MRHGIMQTQTSPNPARQENRMNTIQSRAAEAETAWREGAQHAQRGDLEAAYQAYRTAHDLVVDCPRLHQRAHRQLRQLNWQRRSYRELAIDQLLLGFAPIGIFEIVAYLMTGQVLGSVMCSRRTVTG